MNKPSSETGENEALALDRFALNLGIVSFDTDYPMKNPREALRLGAALADRHFRAALAAGII